MKTLAIAALAAISFAPAAFAQAEEPALAKCAALYDHYDGHVHLEETDYSPFDLTYDYEARAIIARVRAEQLGQRTDWPAAAAWDKPSHTGFFFDNTTLKQCDKALGFEPDPIGKTMFGRKGAADVERPDNLACMTMMIVTAVQLSSPEDDDTIQAIQQHANSMSAPLQKAGWSEDESQAVVQPLLDLFNRRYADTGPVNPHGKLAGDGELSKFSKACIAAWPKQAQNSWQLAAGPAAGPEAPQAQVASTPADPNAPRICRGLKTLLDEVATSGVPDTRAAPADIADMLANDADNACTSVSFSSDAGGVQKMLRCKSSGVVMQNTEANKSRSRQDAMINLSWQPYDIRQCDDFSDWQETTIIDPDRTWSRIGRVFTSPDGTSALALMQTRRAKGRKSLSDQKIRSEVWIGSPDAIAKLDYVPYED